MCTKSKQVLRIGQFLGTKKPLKKSGLVITIRFFKLVLFKPYGVVVAVPDFTSEAV